MAAEAAELEIFKNLLAAVAEEMGLVLGRAAYSPNIKERRDYSCAYFDTKGRLAAQAAHIPVHLGSLPLAVEAVMARYALAPGDTVILNDPFLGGTHLPDITLVSPAYSEESSPRLLGYLASRAHHADVGGGAPGSMSLARELIQEGLVIPPVRLIEGGRINQALIDVVCANVRTPGERRGDLEAQIGAHRLGEERLRELAGRMGWEAMRDRTGDLLRYSEHLTRLAIREIPGGAYPFTDYLDDDGMGNLDLPISVTVRILGSEAEIDFAGTHPEVSGPLNCPLAVTLSAVYYVFRCLTGPHIPANEGCFRPLKVRAPEGTLVNAGYPRAVAGGNVETSQRIVDTLLGALAQALPDTVPAASQGTMNNLSVGGIDPGTGIPFAYYETTGGGMGARPGKDGIDGIHVHMTNTLNTPIEALEFAYPFQVKSYRFVEGSGGRGRYRGGDGIRREIEFLSDAKVSLLTERRRRAPWGLAGGEPGSKGKNILIGAEGEQELPGKIELDVHPGDVLAIESPGGGGWGQTGPQTGSGL